MRLYGGKTECGTHSLHDVHASERAAEIDGSEDNLGDERVLNAYGLENGSSVLLIGTSDSASILWGRSDNVLT